MGTRAEATELDEATLVELSEALTVGRPDLLTRELWNGLAAVLVAKREVEAIDSWISPAAQMWAPWPGLERALAHAELESLDPEAAVERLQRLRTLAPLELRDTQLLAEAQARAGRSGDAIGTWRDLHRRDPLNLEVRRGLALALAAGGELEEARPLLRELLEENPQDRELWSVLAPQEEAASKGTEEDGS